MSYGEGNAACPFLAFEDDRDHRADFADSRHRCFAAAEPEPLDASHQERFCLSVAFAACPIFLDWARAEAAGVVGGASGGAPARKASRTPADVPAFPGSPSSSGRPGRTTPAEAAGVPAHAADPGSGLWGFEGAPKRTVAPPVIPPVATPETSLVTPPMARRQVTKPDWEHPPSYGEFPRLRPRDDRSSNQPLLLALVGVSVVMVALILGPLFAPKGGGPTPSPSKSSASPSSSESVVPTPEPDRTFFVYRVKSGDTLNSIAVRYGISYEQIRAANPQITNPDHIIVGQPVYVPWQTWVIPSPTPELTPTPEFTPTPTPVLTPNY